MEFKKNYPKVSVILPVFNGGNTLLGAVQSIVDQYFLDWELIVIDDGSTDDCINAISSLRDPRIRIQSDGLRRGLAARLNEGINLSLGQYIARMDADDLCFSDRLDRQVLFLENHPEIDLVGCKTLAFTLSEDDIFFHLLPYRRTHRELIESPWKGVYLPHPSWMGRAAWFRKFRYRLPEVLRAEDQELLLRAMPESQYYCLPEILLAYRQGPFDLKKSLLARRELYKSQLSIFFNRQEWVFVLMSTWVTLQRFSFDLLRVLLPSQFIGKMRAVEQVPEETLDKCKDLLRRHYEY